MSFTEKLQNQHCQYLIYNLIPDLIFLYFCCPHGCYYNRLCLTTQMEANTVYLFICSENLHK